MVAEVAVNFIAVIIAAIVSFVLGMIWYSDTLFGKQWRGEMGISDPEMEKMKKAGMGAMMPQFAGAFVASLVMAFVLTHSLVYAAGAKPSLMNGLTVGFWTWLGFVATVLLGAVLWERKTWTYYGIAAGYYLVNLLAMGAILAYWA